MSDADESKLKTRDSANSMEQFAYAAAHDLHEPLRAVTGFARLLREHHASQLDPAGREYLDLVISSALRMQTMLDSLMEYARVRSIERPARPVDPQDALQVALENLRPLIAHRQATVTSEGLQTVLADLQPLAQLFQNLLSNAIKFSQRPPIVQIQGRDVDGHLEICVHDNGIGIPEVEFERIFDAFKRLHPSDTYPGTGLGLAICRQIVERYGGRIWVQSVSGEGSTFCFLLPRPADFMSTNSPGNPATLDPGAEDRSTSS